MRIYIFAFELSYTSTLNQLGVFVLKLTDISALKQFFLLLFSRQLFFLAVPIKSS